MSTSVSFVLTVNADLVPPELLPSLIDELSDLEPVLLDQVGSYLQKEEAQNFGDQGATFGAAWEDLKPATLREKARLGFPAQPLVRTGRLGEDIGQDVSLSPDSIGVGIDPSLVPYAAAQNAHRLLVSITESMIDALAEMLEDWAQSLGIPPGAVQFTPA